MERSIAGGDFKFWVRSEKVFTDQAEAEAYAKDLWRVYGTFSSMFAINQHYTDEVRDIPVQLSEQEDEESWKEEMTDDEWWDYNEWV